MRKRAFRRGLRGAVLAFALLTITVQAQDAGPIYAIQVDGLACPFCAYGIEKQLGAIEGVEAVETEIRSGTVTVTMRAGAALDEETARKAIEAAGFSMGAFSQKEANE